ncbi:MAG: DUF1549 domain-containing protein, partial [Verrucomicrobiaceae bacterium]
MLRRSLILCLFTTSLQAAAPDYSRDILPILSENCFYCHGQDPKGRKADLRLDVEADAKRSHDGVIAIVPGNSAKSAIVERMISHDPEELMPPPKSNRKVTSAQIELIKQWIDAGAKWGEHWAFTRIQKPSVPAALPTTNPIDAFVRAKLVEKGLKPAATAAPRTLVRRLYLDLIGLPPTPEEVDDFLVRYHQHPESSIQQLADKLLANPRHGERWVWEWLDASRYADSNGYQGDNDRTAWPWRDWVIKSINDNLPYNQFTVWQIAGDLLPNATKEQKLATAFLRNHMI